MGSRLVAFPTPDIRCYRARSRFPSHPHHTPPPHTPPLRRTPLRVVGSTVRFGGACRLAFCTLYSGLPRDSLGCLFQFGSRHSTVSIQAVLQFFILNAFIFASRRSPAYLQLFPAPTYLPNLRTPAFVAQFPSGPLTARKTHALYTLPAPRPGYAAPLYCAYPGKRTYPTTLIPTTPPSPVAGSTPRTHYYRFHQRLRAGADLPQPGGRHSLPCWLTYGLRCMTCQLVDMPLPAPTGWIPHQPGFMTSGHCWFCSCFVFTPHLALPHPPRPHPTIHISLTTHPAAAPNPFHCAPCP